MHLPEGGAETPTHSLHYVGWNSLCVPEEPSGKEDSSGVGPEEKSPGRGNERGKRSEGVGRLKCGLR